MNARAWVVGLSLSLFVAANSWADEAAPMAKGGGVEPATTQEEPEKALSIEATLTVPTAYMFRGYVVDDSDIQLQPDISVEYTLQVGQLTLRPHGEIWSNVIPDSDHLGTWNELDLYGGVAIDLPAKFALDLVYDYYNSPADNFDDVHEIGLVVSHDDFLQPHVVGHIGVLMQQGAARRVRIGGLQLLCRLFHGGKGLVEFIATGQIVFGDAKRRSCVGQFALRAHFFRNVLRLLGHS